jgi:hypothetical protein
MGIKEFFTDDKGELSMSRLTALLGFFNAAVMQWYGIIQSKPAIEIIPQVIVWLMFSLGVKTFGAFAEAKKLGLGLDKAEVEASLEAKG